jgi:hypothetical protein
VNVTLNFVHLLILLLHAKADAHQLNNKELVVQNEFADHVTFVLMKMVLLLLVTNEVTTGKAITNVLIVVVMPLPDLLLVLTNENSALQNQPILMPKLIKSFPTETLNVANSGKSLKLNVKTAPLQKSQLAQSSTNQFPNLLMNVAMNTNANALQNFATHLMILYVKMVPLQSLFKVNVA